MEKMLIVVFDDERKAYEGSHALKQLDTEGSITIHAESVITKDAGGKVNVEQADGDFPVRTIGGTAIGSLIGLLGGPVGLGIGAAAGALAGSIADLGVAGVDTDFLDSAAAALKPGKYAVVVDLSEEWVTPVDTRMEALGGTVLRTPRRAFESEQRAKDIAARRAEIAQLKAEYAKAQADRKAKLKAQIDNANAKLQAELDQAKRRSEQVKAETEAKVQSLQQKIEKKHNAVDATLQARADQLLREFAEFDKTAKHGLANQLRETAAQLDS